MCLSLKTCYTQLYFCRIIVHFEPKIVFNMTLTVYAKITLFLAELLLSSLAYLAQDASRVTFQVKTTWLFCTKKVLLCNSPLYFPVCEVTGFNPGPLSVMTSRMRFYFPEEKIVIHPVPPQLRSFFAWLPRSNNISAGCTLHCRSSGSSRMALITR